MQKPHWLYVLYDLTFIPLRRRIGRGFRERSPFAAIIITLLFTPFVSMLYLGRWKRAVVYLTITIAAVLYGRIMTQLNPTFFDMEFSLLDIAIRFIAAFDAYYIAKRCQIPASWYARWYSIVIIIVLLICSAFFAAFTAGVFFIGIFHATTNSMAPAIMKDDVYVIWKLQKHYEYGDIIVHHYPGKPQLLYTRRIVGKPNDLVKMLQGHLYINNEPVLRVPVRDKEYREIMPNGVFYNTLDLDEKYTTYDHFPNYHVPEGHYFVMGDNRDRSEDSRSITRVGFIDKNDILGKVFYICKAPCKLFSH